MSRTVPVAARAFTAAAVVVSTVFAPLAPAVQAQGVPGTVRARSCAVGTDTLSSLGVTAGGAVTVSDGTTARTVTYTTADSLDSVATNLRTALQSTVAIDATGTSSVNPTGAGIGPNINSSETTSNYTDSSNGNAIYYLPQWRPQWLNVPSVITMADVSGSLVSTMGYASIPSGAMVTGPEFTLISDPWNAANVNRFGATASVILNTLRVSPQTSNIATQYVTGKINPTAGTFTVNGSTGTPTIQIGMYLWRHSNPANEPYPDGISITSGSHPSWGLSNITFSTGTTPRKIWPMFLGTQIPTTNGEVSLSGNGEAASFTYDTSSLSVGDWRDTIKDLASHTTHLEISTAGTSVTDSTGTLATNLGLSSRPNSSKPLGDGTYGAPWLDLNASNSNASLDQIVVGNVPLTSSSTSGAFTITKSGVTRAVAWASTDTLSGLAGKIQTALRATSAISPTGTADFATSNLSKVTIVATGKTLTLSDSNSGATGALAKLNLPTAPTASPVVSTATIATSGGSCADTTPPTVSTITTTASGTKKVGDTVTITVTFSEPVTTTGTSSLLLETGTVDTAATCPAVSASTTLTCTYTVASGDTVTRLDIQSISALTGTIADGAGNAYVVANGLPALGASGLYGANLTVDGVAPAAPSSVALAGASDTGISPSDGITKQTNVTVTGTAEAGSTVALRDGGTPIGGATGPATGGTFTIATTLAAGSHTVTATATDPAGNTSAASAPLSITVDTTAPTTASIVRTGGAGQATTGATAPSFTVTFSEAVSGLGATNFAIASGAAIGGTAPSIASVTGAGTTWTVTLGVAGTTGDGSGAASLGLTVVPAGAVTSDVAGNALASASVSGANETYLLTATAPAPSGGGSSSTTSGASAQIPTDAASSSEYSSGLPKRTTPTPSPAPTVITYAASPVPNASTVRVRSSDGRIADLAHAVTDRAGTRVVRSVVEAPTGDHYAVDANGRLEWLDPSRPDTAAIVDMAVVSRLPIAAIETLDLAPPPPGTVLWDASGISGHSLYGVGSDGQLHALPEGPIDASQYRTDAIVPLLSIIQLARLPIGLPHGFDPAKAPPTTYAIERAFGAPELAEPGPLTFTVIFSEPVTGVDAAAFRIAPSTGLIGRLPVVTGAIGAGTTWRVSVDATGATGVGNATIGIEVLPAHGIANVAHGVALTSGIPTDHEERFRLARTVPVVTDIIRASGGAELIGATAVPAGATFTVMFSEPVTGIVPASFAVARGEGIAGATEIASVEGFGTTWTVRVALDGARGDYGADRTATIGLRVVPEASVVTGSAGGRLVSPDVAYRNERFALDNVGPTFRVAYPGRVTGRPVGPGNLDLVVTPSEPLAGAPTIAIDRPGSELVGPDAMGNAQPLTFTYGVLVADGVARLDGTARVALAGTDVAGNPGTVVTEGGTFVIDTGAPVVTSIVRTGGVAALTRGPAMAFTVTLSEPVTGVSIPTFAVNAGAGVTGTPPVIAAVSGRGDTWSVIVSAPGAVADAGTDATATIGLRVVPLGVPVSNARGTALLDPVVYGPNERYRLDNVAPSFTLTMSGGQAPHGIGDVTITARPNEPLSANPVVSVDQAGTADAPSLTTRGRGGALGPYDATWTIRKATGTRATAIDEWVDGTVRAGVTGTDLAGNTGNAVVGAYAGTYATFETRTGGVFVTGITRTLARDALVNGHGPVSFTVTFSEEVTGDGAASYAVDIGRGIGGRAPVISSVAGTGDRRIVVVDVSGAVADFGTNSAATIGLRVLTEPARVIGSSTALPLADGTPNGPNERYELDTVGPSFGVTPVSPAIPCPQGSNLATATPAVCTDLSVTTGEALRAAPTVRVVPSRGAAMDLQLRPQSATTAPPTEVLATGPWRALHRALQGDGARALVEVYGTDLAGNPGRLINGPDTFATGTIADCLADSPDGDGYERYLVELPTRNDTSPQVWVRHRASGRYVYVTHPSEFWRYGIAADLSNLVRVPWGAPVFGTLGPLNASDLFWVRKDTPSGITESYPEVPWANTEALQRAFSERRLVPYGVTGHAVLREQLVALGGDPGYGLSDEECPGDGALASSWRRPVAPRYRGAIDDWDRYLVQLPSASDTNPQVWVRYRKTGEYQYVDGPREFEKFGVLPDRSNLVFVPWGSAVFRAAGPLYDEEEAFWIRNDLTPGVKRDYPQVPLSTTGALGRAFAERRLVPAGVTGWAVLKEQKLLP